MVISFTSLKFLSHKNYKPMHQVGWTFEIAVESFGICAIFQLRITSSTVKLVCELDKIKPLFAR